MGRFLIYSQTIERVAELKEEELLGRSSARNHHYKTAMRRNCSHWATTKRKGSRRGRSTKKWNRCRHSSPLPTNNLLWLLVLLSPFLHLLVTAASLASQARALLHWKSTLQGGQLLASWNIDSPPCNWTGVACSVTRKGGRLVITDVHLPDMSLAGPLDAFNFSALGSLANLNLSYNQLDGTIPPAIATLSQLVTLDLTGNLFAGGIPIEMGSMKGLQFLSLSQNQIMSSVPPSLSNLSGLTHLDLGQNKLRGAIPGELGRLEKSYPFHHRKYE
ncbi:hypothetical protein BHM03_00048032 [Ensete ventricosum]|nr:hypothetical protein BHM03_00048032 [Ensete ventricosum]